MSKREAISRYNIIIKKLRKFPASYQDIENELDLESEIQGYNYRVSKRTFQRDLEDIRAIYDIDIQYDHATKMYFIRYHDQSELSTRILEAFDTFNALKLSDRLSENINFEKRKPRGTENLYGLLHAIKQSLIIRFTHIKFTDNIPTERIVEPYAMKEFNNRWYLLANDQKDYKIKSFALDRMSDLQITKTKFSADPNFDVNKYYEHCFGIVGPNGREPEVVELSFTNDQALYIKSLPLHESQEVMEEKEGETIFRFFIIATYDFVMEILSFGYGVKVLKPQHLVDNVKYSLDRALKQYQ